MSSDRYISQRCTRQSQNASEVANDEDDIAGRCTGRRPAPGGHRPSVVVVHRPSAKLEDTRSLNSPSLRPDEVDIRQHRTRSRYRSTHRHGDQDQRSIEQL